LAKNRFCYEKNEFKEVSLAKKAILEVRKNASIDTVAEVKPLLLAIVRNPIDRFLSGFIDKSIRFVSIYPFLMRFRKPTKAKYCNGCRANMTCFIMTEYQRLMSQVKTKKLSRTFEDFHFFPQSWFV
jgi:hypothetical protein